VSTDSLSPEPEEVVLLDEQGRAIGTAAKHEVHHGETPLHLAFSSYLLDGDGRLLLTRRASHKPTWPGVWTNTCCGHPAPGETLREAVRRRVLHELGLVIEDLRLVLPGFRYRAVMEDGTVENEMCPVVVGHCEDPDRLEPDPDEVDDTEWVPWGDLRASVLTGRRAISPWALEQILLLPDDLDVTTGSTLRSTLPPALTW
jgi:isopentenyl-diphosphate delta-isomerase